MTYADARCYATGFKGYSSYLVGMSEDVPSRSRGDLYALSALRNRRTEIASQIVECERANHRIRCPVMLCSDGETGVMTRLP